MYTNMHIYTHTFTLHMKLSCLLYLANISIEFYYQESQLINISNTRMMVMMMRNVVRLRRQGEKKMFAKLNLGVTLLFLGAV